MDSFWTRVSHVDLIVNAVDVDGSGKYEAAELNRVKRPRSKTGNL
jgi:hypothetical protein